MNHWDQVNAVDRMQAYIEAHLAEKISLVELARVAGYSPWHTERIFKEWTGSTPFLYIRALRLTRAALAMRDQTEAQRILDVALDYDFDSHEGFTRAFSRQFGVLPSQYQRQPEPIPLFMPSKARDYYRYLEKRRNQTMTQKQSAQAVFVQVIERPARKALIKRGIKAGDYFEYCEEVGCDIWGVLTSVKEALYEPAGFWLPASWIKLGTSEYVQGVEVPVDYAGKIPVGLDLIDLPPCKMMIFQGEPFADEDFGEAIGQIWELIDRYDPKLYGFAWAPEAGPRFQLEPRGDRGYIEGRPVKSLT
jgi:AraC-like DNA-binding protein